MIKPTVHAVRDEIEKCTIAGDESLDLTFLANLRKLEAASGKTIVPRLVASFSAVTPLPQIPEP